METGLLSGDLAFREHQFGHTPEPNWPYFLDFAARYLHAPLSKSSFGTTESHSN
jgi:hypothetical protein